MPWENQSGGNKNNPWGSGGRGNGGGKGPNNPWGGGSGKGGDQPDLDEMIRRAQQNFRDYMPGNFGPVKFFGLVILVIAALWMSSGLYTIQPGEHGVIQRFGDYDRTIQTEGLGYHAPWPIETITKVNVNEIRKIPIGFSEGFGQNAQKQDVPAESLMLTSDANIVDLDLVVQWNISSAENFLFEIEEPVTNIKQVAESAIREVVGQTQMFALITQQRDEAAARAKDIMEKTLQEYNAGVNITQVLIQAAEVHPDVQGAFQDVQSAKQDAIERQNKAQAYSKEVLPQARGQAAEILQQAKGYKEAAISRAKGDADRFDSILKSYRLGKEVTRERIYLETMEQILGDTPKTIIEQNGGSGVVPYLPLDKLSPRGTGR